MADDSALHVSSCDPPDISKKRGYAAREIITTELTYIERLKVTVDFFINPIYANRVLDATEAKNQFETLENIFKLHEKYLNLTEAGFHDFFTDLCNNFELYAAYLVNYEPSMQKRGYLLTSNRKFADFVEKTQLQSGCMNLESLLILPVQRIPRYRLLLEQLLKFTPETHPDHAVVRSSLVRICQLANDNNEAIRARENHCKIMEIMMSIEPRTRVQLLDDKERKFIKEGALERQCRKGLKGFQFWLFSDQLLYGEAIPLNPSMFVLNRQIPLAKCFVSSCESMSMVDSSLSSFIVESPAKSFIVRTKNEVEQQEWLNAINNAIKEQQEKSSVERGVVAPLWLPDATTSSCSKCKKAFSLLNRRHHCRNCGHVVCDGCSNKRLFVEHVDARKEVRVCTGCYVSLTGASTDAVDDGYDDSDVEEPSDEGFIFGERGPVKESDLYEFNELCLNPSLHLHSVNSNSECSGSDKNGSQQVKSPLSTVRKSVLGEMLRGAAASAAETGTNFLVTARSKIKPVRSSIYTDHDMGYLKKTDTVTDSAQETSNKSSSHTKSDPNPDVKDAGVIEKVEHSALNSSKLTPPPKPPRPGRKTQRRLNILQNTSVDTNSNPGESL